MLSPTAAAISVATCFGKKIKHALCRSPRICIALPIAIKHPILTSSETKRKFNNEQSTSIPHFSLTSSLVSFTRPVCQKKSN